MFNSCNDVKTSAFIDMLTLADDQLNAFDHQHLAATNFLNSGGSSKGRHSFSLTDLTFGRNLIRFAAPPH